MFRGQISNRLNHLIIEYDYRINEIDLRTIRNMKLNSILNNNSNNINDQNFIFYYRLNSNTTKIYKFEISI